MLKKMEAEHPLMNPVVSEKEVIHRISFTIKFIKVLTKYKG